MAEVKSTNIIPIGIYCILLGVFFLSLTANMLMGNKVILPEAELVFWAPVVASSILGIGLVAVGTGILNLDQMCWKILFFCLVICISSVSSFLLLVIGFLMFGINFMSSYQVPAVIQFAFFSFFLSEIIVLYYLCSQDVVASFGDMGPLISPF